MRERLTDHERETQAGAEPDRQSLGGPPRGTRVLMVVVAVLVLLMFVVLHLSGAVGPGAH